MMTTPKDAAGLPISRQALTAFVKRALAEDLGAGDLTTRSLVPEDATGRATIRAKASGVVAGGFLADETFRRSGAEHEAVLADGTVVAPGDVVGRAKGGLVAMLHAERTALNPIAFLISSKWAAARRASAARSGSSRSSRTAWSSGSRSRTSLSSTSRSRAGRPTSSATISASRTSALPSRSATAGRGKGGRISRLREA